MSGICYLIQAGDTPRVKIGWTTETNRRLKALQSGNAERLRLIRTWEGNRSTERWLHRQFASLRIDREWFKFSPIMLSIEAPTGDVSPVQPLIDKAGGEIELGRICGVARTTVFDWKRTGLIPASRVSQISSKLGVPLAEVIKLAPMRAVRDAA